MSLITRTTQAVLVIKYLQHLYLQLRMVVEDYVNDANIEAEVVNFY